MEMYKCQTTALLIVIVVYVNRMAVVVAGLQHNVSRSHTKTIKTTKLSALGREVKSPLGRSRETPLGRARPEGAQGRGH
jgi:hypothetical protein